MSERVTDEWLRDADRKAAEIADEQYPAETAIEPGGDAYQAAYVRAAAWGDACRLAFARAVARECVRIATEPALGSSDWQEGRHRVAADIRARFGLED